MDTLNKFCPSLILRKRTTPGDPEGFTPTHKPVLTEKEPIDEAALASILGSLLWLSLRTRPDISWAVSRLASLAATEPEETRSTLNFIEAADVLFEMDLRFRPCVFRSS
eukprot:1009339-Amphidinium_carterae.1